MVVPVPVVLQEENVKTLEARALRPHRPARRHRGSSSTGSRTRARRRRRGVAVRSQSWRTAHSQARPRDGGDEPDLGVKIEAQFAVGEYEIVILSAQDSGGLDTWLHREGYNIPEGGEPYFRPYVASGSKFFVAKVNVKKVKLEDGVALALAAPLPLRQRGVQAAGAARAHQLDRHAGPHRPHPRARHALRGRELPERHHPDEPRRERGGLATSSAPSTRRSSTARSRRTRRPSSPSTRGSRPRAIPAPVPR